MRAVTWSVVHGREGELAAVDEMLSRASAGRLQALLLEGEAGIGKTRLLLEAVSRAERLRFSVYFGSAIELEVGRPFGVVADALSCIVGAADPRRAEIAERVSTGWDGDADAGLRYRIVDGLVEVLESSSLEGPVALVLDDLQWADTSTLMTLAAVAHRLAPLPLAICAAFRPSPAPLDLQRLVEALTRDGATHLVVGPLKDDAVEALVAGLLGASAGPKLLAQVRSASGNPLFVGELLAGLHEEGLLELSEGHVEVGDSRLPAGLRETILRRLSFLSANALELLRLAAVLGASFQTSELSVVSGTSARMLLGALEEPIRARVLQAEVDSIRFRHELIRMAVYQNIPPGLRKELHVETAQALASAGMPAARVASHFSLGASRGDVEAVGWLRRAASDVAFKDPSTGVRLLQRALDLLPDRAPERDGVRSELVMLLAHGGRPEEAERTARELLATAVDPSVEGPVRAALVHCLFIQGRWSEVVAEVDIARDLPTVEQLVRGRLLAESALARIWTGDLGGAETDAREAVRLGRECEDPVAVASGLGHLSVVADQRGEFQEGVALAQRGVEAAVAGHAPEAERRHPHISLGMALFAADRLREATQALHEGRRLGERMGTVWDLPLYHTMLALPMTYLGEWDDAVAEAESGLTLAHDLGSGVGRVTAHALLATIAVHRDELGAASSHVDAADAVVAAAGPQWGMFWLAMARAALEEATTGMAERGLALLVDHWAETNRCGSLEGALRLGPSVVRAALRTGDSALATAVAGAMESGAVRARVPYADAAAFVCTGLVRRDATPLLRAVELYRADERLPEQAAAHEDVGWVLAEAGLTRQATPCFEQAVVGFERLGATRDAGRVLARMRSFGLRRGARRPQVRASTGWGALTETEQKVVRLAVEGLTNKGIGERLFVSPRTVQTHMAHIFVKLGISSRVQLVAKAGSS